MQLMPIIKIRFIGKNIDKIKVLKYNKDINNLLTRTFCLRTSRRKGFYERRIF